MKPTTDYSVFSEFILKQNRTQIDTRQPVAVIYPRVSSKEQSDTNGSLETQEKMCRNFSERMKIPIIAKFGGTYESAATEERKEFKKMMEYIKNSKENIRYIIVSDVDRFSRTGPNAIYLAEQLRQRGIQILAVSNPIDTLNPLGAFQQNMQFLFANYDNQIRRERTIRGMKQKFENGYIIGKAPMGYSQSRVNNEMVLTINETGKAIAKAFKWKAEQKLPSAEIAKRLQKMGIKIREKQLSRIFRNLFYCGLLSNSMLGDKIVKGRWPALVSQEIFLKANEVLSEVHPSKYNNKRENEDLPLKQLISCGKCGTMWTGYIVKRKNIYYYKCNTKGCKCNKSAKSMHSLFSLYLKNFELDVRFCNILRKQLEVTFNYLNGEQNEEQKILQLRLKDVQMKLESVDEKFIDNKIDENTYKRFRLKYEEELSGIREEIQKSSFQLSNPKEFIEKAIGFCQNLSGVWVSSNLQNKKQIQKVLFPEGLAFDMKNDTYRTGRVNELVRVISSQSRVLAKNKKGNSSKRKKNSPLVPRRGIEPLLPP